MTFNSPDLQNYDPIYTVGTSYFTNTNSVFPYFCTYRPERAFDIATLDSSLRENMLKYSDGGVTHYIASKDSEKWTLVSALNNNMNDNMTIPMLDEMYYLIKKETPEILDIDYLTSTIYYNNNTTYINFPVIKQKSTGTSSISSKNALSDAYVSRSYASTVIR